MGNGYAFAYFCLAIKPGEPIVIVHIGMTPAVQIATIPIWVKTLHVIVIHAIIPSVRLPINCLRNNERNLTVAAEVSYLCLSLLLNHPTKPIFKGTH
jgi:hypothetical protein